MPDAVPRRVALVAACPFPTSQGSQVFLHQLALALTRAGHEVHAVTYGFGEFEAETPYPLHRISPLVPSRKLRAGPSVWKPVLDGLLARRLLAVCRRHRIEILHAVNYEAALVACAVRWFTGLPVLYHAHGILELELPTYFRSRLVGEVMRRLGAWIERRILAGADGVMTLCSGDAAHARRLARPGVPVVAANPGIEIEPSEPAEDPSAGVDCPPGPVFVYAGNLDRYQGLDTVLLAFARIAARMPEAELVVATASDPAPLHTRVRALGLDGRVRVVVGCRFAETARLIRCASAALVPRRVPYGFPIKLLNYMALGVPAIVGRDGYDGLRHGESIYVCEPTPESFARGMLELAGDPILRARIGEAARRVAQERYAWPAAVDRIGAVYEQLLERSLPDAVPAGARAASS